MAVVEDGLTLPPAHYGCVCILFDSADLQTLQIKESALKAVAENPQTVRRGAL